MAPMVLRIASLAAMGKFITIDASARPLRSGAHGADTVADLSAVQVFPPGAKADKKAGARKEDHTEILTRAFARDRTDVGTRSSAEVKAKVEKEFEANSASKVTGKAKAEAEAKARNADMLERAMAEAKARREAKQARAKASGSKAMAEEDGKAQAKEKQFEKQLTEVLDSLKADRQMEQAMEDLSRAGTEAKEGAKAGGRAKDAKMLEGAMAEARAMEGEATRARGRGSEEAEARTKAGAEARAKALTEAKATAEAKAKGKEKSRAEAEATARAKAEAEAKARQEAEVKTRAARAKAEAEAKAKAEASKQPDTHSQGGPSSGQRESMAYGDPHMQNILGQRFDLMQPGSHTLVLIPRLAPERESELLRVQAGVQRIGRACADMYITTLNVTGRWAEARRRPHGLHFNAAEPADRRGTNWMHFGSSLGHLDLKVVYGQTPTGTRYLNFFVRRLGQVGCRVGGLLGEDDHTAATMPDSQCKNILVLLEGIPADRGEPARSAAGASLL